MIRHKFPVIKGLRNLAVARYLVNHLPMSFKPETEKVMRRASVVLGATLLSRLLGAVRDPVLAASFSLKATDAFFVAFTIPNTLRVLLGEGAASAAVIPVLTNLREREGAERAKVFVRNLFAAALLVLICLTILGIVFADAIVPLFAAGYKAQPDKYELTLSLTRLCFPYIAYMGLTAIVMGVLQTADHFFWPAFLSVPSLCDFAALRSCAGGRGLLLRAEVQACILLLAILGNAAFRGVFLFAQQPGNLS